MKKLKMHKAVLEICLALPITLTISNAINAMDNNPAPHVSQIDKNSKCEGNKNQTNKKKTLTKAIKNFEKEHKGQEKTNDEQIIQLLQEHIANDKMRYLASMIQTTCKCIPQTTNNKGATLVRAHDLCRILRDHPEELLTGNDINKKNNTKGQIDNLLAIIKNLETKSENQLSIAAKILSILLTSNWLATATGASKLDQLQNLLFLYSIAEYNADDQQYNTLIISLEQVGELLKQETTDLNKGRNTEELSTLGQIVIEFIKEYKSKKTNPTQNKPKQTLQKTIIDYIQREKIQGFLDDAQQRALLSEYKKGYKNRHLAALIQTNFQLITPPLIKVNDASDVREQLQSDELYNILYEIPPKAQTGYATKAIINQTGDISKLLQEIHKIEQTTEDDLTKEETILRILFTNSQANLSLDIYTPEQMQGLIDDYQNDESHPADTQHQQLISFLDQVAYQLEQEIQHTCPGTEQEQLQKLVEIVRNFSKAYKNKIAHPEKYQKKPQQQNKKQPSKKQPKLTQPQPITQELQKRQQQSQQQKKQEIQQRQQKLLQKLLQKRQDIAKQRGFDKFSENVPQTTHTQELQLYVANRKGFTRMGAEEYQQFLKSYINNRPEKYLALLIQAKYNFIQFPENLRLTPSPKSNNIYDMLSSNTYQHLQPSFLMDQGEPTKEIEDILREIDNIKNNKTQNTTAAAQIIKILFTTEYPWKLLNKSIDTLQELIGNYRSQEQPEEWRSYNSIFQYLGGIARQLHNEAKQLRNPTSKAQLTKLAKQIKNVSKVYVAKHAQEEEPPKEPKQTVTEPLQKPQQQQPKKNASQRTHIKALQVYVKKNPNKKLEVEEYNKFLISYINNNIATYLALLLQANYKLLQFPDNIQEIDSAINYTTLYKNFAKDNCAIIYPYSFMDDTTRTTAIKWKLQDLQQIYKTTTRPLKPAEQILNILFNPAPQGADYETRLGILAAAIDQYIATPTEETSNSYHYTLIYLGQIAQQLQEEANALPNSKTKQQLKALATQINRFFKKYAPKNGLPEPEDEEEEEEEEDEEEGKRNKEEAEKRKQAEEEAEKGRSEEERRHKREEIEKGAKERQKTIEKLMKEINAYFNKNNQQDSKLSTTQKIINNLSATNNMLQIINLILY